MKHLVFSIIMGAASLLLLSGCSGIKELNSAMADTTLSDNINANDIKVVRNKTTKAEVMRVIGAPNLVFKDDGVETWVYQRVAVRQSDVGFQVQAHFAAYFPYKNHSLRRGAGVAGVGAAGSVGANRSSYKSASLVMRFNENGCVNSYEFTATSF